MKTTMNDFYRDDAATILRVMHHTFRKTTILCRMMMLLIVSSVLALKVSIFLILPELLLVSFAQAKEASIINNDRKLVDDTSKTNKNDENRERRRQLPSFDAMGLTYSDTKEVEKSLSAKKNMRIEQNILSRQLDRNKELLATRRFPECVEQSLSPEGCQTWIQQQIEDAGGHEVGDVKVKIQTPRTPEQFSESYWMVEVPVNLYNKVACDRNDGRTYYPLKWADDVTGASLDVENQDCLGLSAGECCLKLREYGKRLTISGYDENRQCLSCFVHQEPLEPVLNKGTGETDYFECTDLENGDCVGEQLTGAEVDVLDLQTVRRIEAAIDSLESFQTDRSCDTFDQLLESLYNAATVIYPLSIKIGRLACMVCYGIHDLNIEDNNILTLQLAEILMMLKKHDSSAKQIDSKENCIIIYTNPDGKVVRVPTLGGSRSDMRDKEIICEDDTDCSDTEWCDIYGYCSENVCVTTPPEDCQGETQVCEPSPYDNYYTCVTIDCNRDPSICKENEYCKSKRDHFYFEETYICEEYKSLGQDCGISYYGNSNSPQIFDGYCDPDVAFCLDPYSCTYLKTPSILYSHQCFAFGEGSCVDEDTGEMTQDNCKNDEYCDNPYEKCKPNRNMGECCRPEFDNCGFGSEQGTLICAPYQEHLDFYGYVKKYYTCQKICDTDDDCGTNEFCSPVDKDNDPPIFPGRFCKEYKGLGDYCNIQLPGLIDQLGFTEDRCDPLNSYCYDPTFCLTISEQYFQSQCVLYGNVCTDDLDCANATTEWCDVDVGYCKIRPTPSDCCTTVGDENKNDCPHGSSCELTPPFFPYNVGAAVCTYASVNSDYTIIQDSNEVIKNLISNIYMLAWPTAEHCISLSFNNSLFAMLR